MPLLSAISKDKFEGAERRTSPREPVKWVVLSYFDKNNWAQILDISERGMLLECAHLPLVRQRITFAFEVMGSAPAQFRNRSLDKSLSGEAVWTRQFERMAGVQFADLAEESWQQIRQSLSVETSGSSSPEKERYVRKKGASSQTTSGGLPGASEASNQANSDTAGQHLEFFESAGNAHAELRPPFGEEILELPDSANDSTFAAEAQEEYKLAGSRRRTRLALIGISSCLAILALAAGAKIIESGRAREARAFEQRQNPGPEAARTSSVTPVAGVPRPFLVEVLDINNRRWTLWFVKGGSRDEVREISSKPGGTSTSLAPSHANLGKRPTCTFT